MEMHLSCFQKVGNSGHFVSKLLFFLFKKLFRPHFAFSSLQGMSPWIQTVDFHFIISPGSSSHRCPTFCHGFRVERNVSWKRCTTGLEMFSLVWWVCQKCQPNQQQHVYKPRGIKETARTMSPSEVVYKCVCCSSVYAAIKDIRRHVK